MVSNYDKAKRYISALRIAVNYAAKEEIGQIYKDMNADFSFNWNGIPWLFTEWSELVKLATNILENDIEEEW